jgi:hypothetical protein
MRTVLKGDTAIQRARAKIGNLCTKVINYLMHLEFLRIRELLISDMKQICERICEKFESTNAAGVATGCCR